MVALTEAVKAVIFYYRCKGTRGETSKSACWLLCWVSGYDFRVAVWGRAFLLVGWGGVGWNLVAGGWRVGWVDVWRWCASVEAMAVGERIPAISIFDL